MEQQLGGQLWACEEQREEREVTHCGDQTEPPAQRVGGYELVSWSVLSPQSSPGVLLVGATQHSHGENDQQYGLLMDVPTKEERGPGTERQASHKLDHVGRAGPQLGQGGEHGQDGEDGRGEGRDVW